MCSSDLFAVDTHDDMEIKPDFPDYDAWMAVRRFNRKLKSEIEAQLASEGMPTAASLRDLVARRPTGLGGESASTPRSRRPGLGRSGWFPWRLALWALLILVGLGLLGLAPAKAAPGKQVQVIRAQGVINPVMSGYLTRGIECARSTGAEAVVIQMDTPGGLDTSMREIIQAIVEHLSGSAP